MNVKKSLTTMKQLAGARLTVPVRRGYRYALLRCLDIHLGFLGAVAFEAIIKSDLRAACDILRMRNLMCDDCR